MWGLEILAAKNSSAAKQAAFPARCKMAGKALDRALDAATTADPRYTPSTIRKHMMRRARGEGRIVVVRIGFRTP